jgi:hypothetical protein
MVQHRIATFVINRQRNASSVGDMLQHLNWDSLEDRLNDAQLVMTYKIANVNVAIIEKDRLKTITDSFHKLVYNVYLIKERSSLNIFNRATQDTVREKSDSCLC